jgi:hypothetical protein
LPILFARPPAMWTANPNAAPRLKPGAEIVARQVVKVAHQKKQRY